jgi:hypothetical protein
VELGERFRHLLVDEFQDTDPIQAEVCFLLASPVEEGNDWRMVTPRPGALFVVGDPKQSIYRFRRADIGIYNQVKERLSRAGEVLNLTRNFRSTTAIGTLVNDHFRTCFPPTASPRQAAFGELEAERAPAAAVGVHRLLVSSGNRDDVVHANADQVASWIAGEVGAKRRTAGDFLVLTWVTKDIEPIARALAERNVPAVTTGAPLMQDMASRAGAVAAHAGGPGERCSSRRRSRALLRNPPRPLPGRSAGAVCSHRLPPRDTPSDALMRLHQWWACRPAKTRVLLDGCWTKPDCSLGATSRSVKRARARCSTWSRRCDGLVTTAPAICHAWSSSSSRCSSAKRRIHRSVPGGATSSAS